MWHSRGRLCHKRGTLNDAPEVLMCRMGLLLLSVIILTCPAARGADDADAEKNGKLPHVEFYPKKKQVRVECEMLGVNAPLEFFCCVKGTNDYEAMIRSEV